MIAVVLSALALVLAVVAVVLAVLAARRTVGPWSRRREDPDAGLPDDVLGLRQEVAALRLDSATALRHLAVVRYDAFADTGGNLSWSAALLDDHGDGLVITSIHGRSDARTYAKSVAGWACEQPLSPEETDAIGHARPS